MKKVAVYIALSSLIFSTMEVGLKIAQGAVDPFQMTFLRFLIGGACLLPFGLMELRGKGLPSARLLAWQAALGVVCVPVSMVLFQLSVTHSNAATVAVIFCSNPIFIALFAHFLNKNDRLTKLKLLAIAPAAAGIIFMARPWDMRAGDSAVGVLLSISSAMLFALYSTLSARTLDKAGTCAQTSASFIFGALALLIAMLIAGIPAFDGLAANLPIILYVGIVVTGGGYILFFLAVKSSNSTTASLTFFFKPAIAPVMAVIVLGETITWNVYAGIALVLLASYMIIYDKRKTG
ncbi:MAG: DMT family transporter [Clostridiales Family XIII bacterium]|jgi:drug/metabolite transporter (DMT)-like permease|nr:DMT family transporter [Clostridiales Family XIII bacterium]